MTRVRIRTDVSVAIGTGHFMRCLCLADALARSGLKISFATRALPQSLVERLAQSGHQHVRLPGRTVAYPDIHTAWPTDVQEQDAADTIADGDAGVVVVDHYGLGSAWERAVRASGRQVVAIDDLAREHLADVVLDQNFVRGLEARYDGKVPAQTRRLLGPRFALLRNEFAAERSRLKSREGLAERLVVFMGGTDPGSATETVLDGLRRLRSGLKRVDVVMGSSAPGLETVRAICANVGYHIHVDTGRMAELMAAADIAIGGGGTATYERMVLGLPSIAICLADNQRAGLEALDEQGALVLVDGGVEASHVARAVEQLLGDPERLRQMSSVGMTLVDGRGASRVAGRIGALTIKLRRAGPADSARLHDWRNHPAVRAASRNSEPIGLNMHDAWLNGLLADPRRHLLIGETDGLPVGVVRFDCDGPSAEISIYMVPDRLGAGLGTPLLLAAETWLGRNVSGIRRLAAETLPGNSASAALFERCDYRRNGDVFEKDLDGEQ